MKLYEVPNKTWVKVKNVDGTRVPPAAPGINDGQVIFFDHIDGMYSYCKDRDDNLIHLVAWAEVEVVDDPRK